MSETTKIIPAEEHSLAVVESSEASMNSVWSPQSIMGLYAMTIVAGTVCAVMVFGTPEARSQTIGQVIGIGMLVVGFYFGSSKGSQDKDQRSAIAPPPPVLVTSGPLPSVTPVPGSVTAGFGLSQGAKS